MKTITYLIISVIFLPSLIRCQVNLFNGIVFALPINGSLDDESQNGNDCDLSDGIELTEDRFGLPNSALLFEGNSYLECGIPTALDELSLPVSISFWYKVSNEDINEFLPILFTDDNIGNMGNYFGFFSFFQNQKFWFGYGDGTGALIQDRRGMLSDDFIIADTWTNIIGTIDENKNISIFINGINARGTINGESDLEIVHNENYPIRIGLRSRYGPVYFKGKLDEIYLWNRVLSFEEIREIVDGGLTTSNIEYNFDLKVTTYPNPANSEIIINGLNTVSKGKINIEMIDYFGRKIKSFKVNPIEKYQINITNVPSGYYFLRFITGNSIYSKAIIVSY